MIYLNKPIAYLQDSDFDKDGNLLNDNIPTDIPVVLLIQAAFCGYCTMMKPAFQEFAEKNKGVVFCATIQGDGKELGEKELNSRIKSIDKSFRGYPSIVGYKNKKFVKTHTGGRTLNDLELFSKSF